MKALLLASMLSGQYCGVDVPYDFIIVDDVLAIRDYRGIEECRFDGKRADCDQSFDMDISEDAYGNLVAKFPNNAYPVVMPKCS